MRSGAFRRVALELSSEELVPLPRLPETEGREQALAGLLRELFTGPGGRLEARMGAVLIDGEGQPRALTAPFGGEWPRSETLALELFATAKKVGCSRLVLFRTEPSTFAEPAFAAFHIALDIRALGLIFELEIEDLVILRPGSEWILSRAPVLGESLHCEATLHRTLGLLIAHNVGRTLSALDLPGKNTETAERPDASGLLARGPRPLRQREAL